MLSLHCVCPFCYTDFETNARYLNQESGIREQVSGNRCPHCNAFECVGVPLNAEGYDLRFVGNKIWLKKDVNCVKRHKFFTAYTHTKIYPFEITEDMIDIRDIAHSCSLVCRFGGHLDVFYSSGQHQITVAQHCSSKNKLKGLLHDSTDGYMGDMVSPMKYHPIMLYYRAYEAQLLALIFKKHGLTPDIPQEVHEIDLAVQAAECRDMSDKTWWQDLPLVVPMKMKPRPNEIVEQEYLRMFERLTK